MGALAGAVQPHRRHVAPQRYATHGDLSSWAGGKFSAADAEAAADEEAARRRPQLAPVHTALADHDRRTRGAYPYAERLV